MAQAEPTETGPCLALAPELAGKGRVPPRAGGTAPAAARVDWQGGLPANERWAGFEAVLRLAMTVAGASAAMIVLDAPGAAVTRISLGLDSPAWNALDDLGAAILRERRTMVVSDICQDGSLALCHAAAVDSGLRFAAGTPIVMPDGEAIGVLWVLDSGRRERLDAPARRGLADLTLLLCNRIETLRAIDEGVTAVQREELVGRLMRLTAEADGFDAAFKAVADMLRRAVGAALCVVWRASSDGERVTLVGGAVDESLDAEQFLARRRALHLTLSNSNVGEAIRTGRQVISTVLPGDRINGAGAIPVRTGSGTLRPEPEILVGVSTPLPVGQDRYAVKLGLARVPDDLPAICDLLRDVTVALGPLLRRRADDEMSRLFRRAVEANTTPVLITDAQTDAIGPRIVYLNPAFEASTGYGLAEVVGQSPRFLQGSETSPETRRAIRQAIAAGEPICCEIDNRDRSGRAQRILMEISPVRDQAGEVTHFVGIRRDITEQFAAERAREALASELSALISAMPGVLIRQRPGPGTFWTRTFVAETIERLTGYTSEEAKEEGWWRRGIEPSNRKWLTDRMFQAYEGAHGDAEFRFRRKDGAWIWIRIIMRGHVSPAGEREVIAIWSDITHEWKMAQHLSRSARLAQLGELATGMAHELNQPLAAISMAAENAGRRLARDTASVPQIAHHLQLITDQALRASRIIDHMRVFGRDGASERRAVPLRDAVAGAMTLLANLMHEHGVELIEDIPEDLPPIKGQSLLLEQVLVNLITNTCDAYARCDPPDPARPRWIEISARPLARAAGQPADRVCILVRDQAGGIPPEVLPRVFEPFFTTRGPGKSTGLGLSLAFGFVSEMGGMIQVASSSGETLFTLDLPAWTKS